MIHRQFRKACAELWSDFKQGKLFFPIVYSLGSLFVIVILIVAVLGILPKTKPQASQPVVASSKCGPVTAGYSALPTGCAVSIATYSWNGTIANYPFPNPIGPQKQWLLTDLFFQHSSGVLPQNICMNIETDTRAIAVYSVPLTQSPSTYAAVYPQSNNYDYKGCVSNLEPSEVVIEILSNKPINKIIKAQITAGK
jgi:hypothetical protein